MPGFRDNGDAVAVSHGTARIEHVDPIAQGRVLADIVRSRLLGGQGFCRSETLHRTAGCSMK